jgi:hypothetical protein
VGSAALGTGGIYAVRTVVFALQSVGYLVVLIIKARGLPRHRSDPFLWALCITLTFATLATFAGIPAIATALETASGMAAVWGMAPSIVACAGVWLTVLTWAGPVKPAQRRLQIGLAGYCAALILLLVLCLASRGRIPADQIAFNEDVPEPLWAGTLFLRDAILVYCAVLAFTWSYTATTFFGMARRATRKWLRRGAKAILIGQFFLVTYVVSFAGYFIAYRNGFTFADPQQLGSFAVLGSAIAAVGISLPVVGPRWDRLTAYRQLAPLWSAIRTAAPDVVLDDTASGVGTGWTPWKLSFRLYRRVIEIRDGILALRPYFDADLDSAVRARAQKSGHNRGQIDAIVLAAQLAVAVHHERTEPQSARPAISSPAGRGDHRSAANEHAGGHDLDSELTLLVPVAQAFTASPIVREAVEGRDSRDSADVA